MLVPMGTTESDGGYPCQIFAMVSNFDDDHVEQDLTGSCTNAMAYCGIRDRLYPDKRNMGFPFDRVAKNNNGSLNEFMLPNMNTIDCKIIFTDEIIERPSQVSKTDNTSSDSKKEGD